MAVDKLVDSTQLDADLTTVANAIRTKGGTSAQLSFPNGMAQAISDIPTGSSPVINLLSVTANGTYTAPTGVDGYSPVTVNVQGITPSGTINITDTALTDVTNYANAQVVDADLVAGNIKKDVSILGVVGTYEGGGGTFLGGIRFDTVNANNNPTEITLKMLKTGLPVLFYASSYCGFSSGAITKINIDGNPTEIPTSFNRNSSTLQSVNLPNSLTKIGTWAFGNNYSLVLNSLPSGLVTLGEIAFGSPSGGAVAGVTVNISSLPSTLVTIDNEAFENAIGGTISHIPSTVTKIGNKAFKSSDATKRMIDTVLYFDGTPTTISATAFEGNTWITDIYVPWAEGAVANAPWGATNATIHYGYTG